MRRVVLLSLWMSMARADVTADFDAFEVERRAKAAIDMAGCPERTQWQHATLPNELEPGIPSAVYWLNSLLSADDAAGIVAYLREHATFSTHPGSTDMQPEYASYIYTHGSVNEDAPWKHQIWTKLSELLASCVTPFVRHKFACATCVPCTSLVRRYRPKERKQIFAHISRRVEGDADARATADKADDDLGLPRIASLLRYVPSGCSSSPRTSAATRLPSGGRVPRASTSSRPSKRALRSPRGTLGCCCWPWRSSSSCGFA